jgi:beclin 1
MEDNDAEQEVQRLRKELEAVEAERALVRRRRAQVEGKRRRLRWLQSRWWVSNNAAERTLVQLIESRRAVLEDVARAEARLQALVQLNAANDCFYIWHAGPFATINGCRLGRLPAYMTVEWADINAGLGQVVLLLDTLVRRAGFRFRNHQLVPLGSFSKIIKLPPGGARGGEEAGLVPSSPRTSGGNALNLYYDEANLVFFPRRNLNAALVAFLQCVEEFGTFVERQDPTLRLPHRIQEGGKVGGLSISLVQGEEEAWTRALKYLLTDLKWLLAWSAKHVVS